MTRPSGHQRAVNGKVLCLARLRLGLTQAQVSGLIREAGLYMDDSRVSKLELGKIPYPSPRLRAVLTRVYELTDAEMTAPCETCGQEWSPACMDHATDGELPATAGDEAAEETGERRKQPSAA